MIKLLESSGFVVVHTRGSHCKLRKEDRVVTVPLNRDPLRIGTQKAILDQAGISL
jgi:predicted RNA binding protein YcfA (HicA-like mRNA interferase family)